MRMACEPPVANDPMADAESTCYAAIMIFVSNGGAVLSLGRQCNEAISNKGSLIVTRP
jgi:hypothetical protein